VLDYKLYMHIYIPILLFINKMGMSHLKINNTLSSITCFLPVSFLLTDIYMMILLWYISWLTYEIRGSLSYFVLHPFSPKFGACKKLQKKHEITISFSYTRDVHKARRYLQLNWSKNSAENFTKLRWKFVNLWRLVYEEEE
jgi:hypothetical protein